MHILDTIIAHTKERIQSKMQRIPLAQVRALAESRIKESSAKSTHNQISFEQALKKPKISLDSNDKQTHKTNQKNTSLHLSSLAFICEVKKASPSQGVIHQEFPYVKIAKSYQDNGADAISCLTEPHFFLGSDAYFEAIRQNTTLPMLRKDFTINAYMVYEACAMGADAILLIASVLDSVQMQDLYTLSKELKMSALIETHSAQEIENALCLNPHIIGVNNRDLRTFKVDLQTSIALRRIVPQEITFVSESGIKSLEDLKLLQAHNVDAVLIGEWFMRMNGAIPLIQTLP